ncbi:unnamed protein product [Closterium sp. NIES-54]
MSSSSFPIAAVVVPVVVVVLVLLLAVFLWRRWHSERLARMLRKEIGSSSRVFSLAELRRATKEWQAEIGRGGYGSVYKAVLKDKTVVAVKRLDVVSDQGDREFIREVELLSRVHHRHLVNLLGFCAEKEERALVYEYMGLGSLFDHLHGPHAKETPLSWDSRIKIAIHVALGIDYLHYGADPPLIHRDIKSGNILLSEDGLAKSFYLCHRSLLRSNAYPSVYPCPYHSTRPQLQAHFLHTTLHAQLCGCAGVAAVLKGHNPVLPEQVSLSHHTSFTRTSTPAHLTIPVPICLPMRKLDSSLATVSIFETSQSSLVTVSIHPPWFTCPVASVLVSPTPLPLLPPRGGVLDQQRAPGGAAGPR